MTTIAIASLISFWAPVYGVPSDVALAVATYESSLNPEAVGALGELGLFQLRPEFYDAYTKEQLRDPVINITLGLKHLRMVMDHCQHKEDLGYLVCYNVGVTKAKKIKHPSQFPYVRQVKKIMLAQADVLR